MEHKHLDATTFERLLALDRTAEQNEQLFHLLAVCPRCHEIGGWLLELHQANALPPAFGPIDAALARSRAEAPALLKELLPLAPEERLARLHDDPRFVSWGLCELLIRRSCQTAPEQPAEAFHLADLAVHMADRISESGLFEERWVYQLRSLAWAALGNALRVQGDLNGAERGFDCADSWWEAGTVDTDDALGYEPVLLDLKASLRVAQRRFPDTFKLLAEAVDLFLNGEHRDPHLAGRSLIKKAGAHIEQGDTESAIQALKKANGLIDPKREPRLLLCFRHNLADNLSKAGEYREAAALLPDLKELATTHGSAKDRLRLDWVEGRVAAGLGDHEQARQLLTKIRQTFLDESNAFDAALAALDLSISYLQEGKTAEVRELADEMVTVFQALDVAREPLAALPPLPRSRPPRNRHRRSRPRRSSIADKGTRKRGQITLSRLLIAMHRHLDKTEARFAARRNILVGFAINARPNSREEFNVSHAFLFEPQNPDRQCRSHFAAVRAVTSRCTGKGSPIRRSCLRARMVLRPLERPHRLVQWRGKTASTRAALRDPRR